ncbi:hypothetical protein BDZ91DRAFT_803284 [Kalaharituber pfeilii]|nr:hypothetical protein BDZ91DRAFT_803284 [Kalaharituber pfeilii]
MATIMMGVNNSIQRCTAYSGTDHILGPTLIFIDIQPNGIMESHIFTIAGYKHYPRLMLNHTNPAYQSAVSYLSTTKQGSELHRGLAITIMRFFMEMPHKLRYVAQEYNLQNDKMNNKYDNWSVIPIPFEGQHAADLAGRMSQVESSKFLPDFLVALGSRTLSWLDLDVVVRGGTFKSEEEFPPAIKRLMKLFGEPTCLPSAKLQRTPSAYGHSRHKSFVENKDPAVLEREVQDLVLTERNYVSRMHRLLRELVYPMRETASSLTVPNAFPTEAELGKLFPPCLDEIIEANTDFSADVDEALEQEGVNGVARVCLQYFPSFKRCYQEYLRASPSFTQLYSQFAKNKSSLFVKMVEEVGEQQLKSWLIDPVQRLPRYTLYIDNILSHVDVGSELFMTLNKARDIITDICSLQSSDSAERSQTIQRLQGMIPSWPRSLKPQGRLITAVDLYEILPPYNSETSEPLASILLLFHDCVVILRRPKSTTLYARGIMAEVDRPASMKTSTASKKEGLDLVFAGWCDLDQAKFVEAEDGAAIWMQHHVDLEDNWTKGGEAGIRKFALLNAYERKARKFTEEVAIARQERRCANDPAGLVGIRVKDINEYTSFWCSLWGNEFEGYRNITKGRGKYVLFLGDQPGSLQGSLEQELADGFEIVFGLEPVSDERVKFEIHALGHATVNISRYKDFWHDFHMNLCCCFLEMNTMDYEPETRAPCLLSANERLLKSFNVSYDGHATSRLTRKLRPPSPVKLLNQVFGSSVAGSGNSSPTKMAKPVLLSSDRVRLPPPRASRAELSDAQQKITLVKDERETLDTSGMSVFVRLEKLVEVYIQGLRTAVMGHGFNLMAPPEYYKEQGEASTKEFEACKVYTGFVKFFKEEWIDKIGVLVGRKGLTDLLVVYERQEYDSEFLDFFGTFLSEMTPQNRRAFKNIMTFCNELMTPIEEDERALLLPSFVNLLHLDDADGDDLNFDMRYVRLVYFVAFNSEALFNDTPRSHDASLENTPVKDKDRDTRVRRAHTVTAVGAASQTLRKKFNQVAGSIRGDHQKPRSQDSNENVSRVASVLRNLSKKDRNRLVTSKSVDEAMGTETIKPIRPASSDRPLLVTAFTSPSNESITPPLETILGSPVEPDNKTSMGPPTTRRKKRRSSLSDLHTAVAAGEKPDVAALTTELLSRSGATIYGQVPTRPAAPSPTDPKTGAPVRKGSKNTVGEINAPEPSVSPSPAPGSKGQRDRSIRERKENISRKPVPKTPAKPSSNQTLRASTPLKLRERVSVERNALNEADIALQREMAKMGEELRRGNRSRGPSSTASSSVASSASSAYATSYTTTGSSSNTTEEFRKLATRVSNTITDLRTKYEACESDLGGELIQREEFIRDQEVELAKKDMEIQSLRSELRKREIELARKDDDIKTLLRQKDEELKADLGRKDAEFAKKEEEHKAELKKRDRAMKGLNKLYDDLNLEQDELFRRVNEELEAIARAAAALGNGRGNDELWKALEQARTNESQMRKDIITLKREIVKLKAKTEPTN